MKKIYYLFLLLPLLSFFSCSDDKDFSPVDMTITLDGVTLFNNNFYMVQGDDLTIAALEAKAIDGKSTAVTNVIFYLDGVPLVGTPANPFMGTLSTENFPAGKYGIEAAGNLLQVDQPIKVFAVEYPITIVKDEASLPEGAPELGRYSLTIRMNN